MVQYNSRAVPCASYIAQLEPPPESIIRDEMAMANTVMHLPPFSLSLAASTQLAQAGMIQPKSITAMAIASLSRAANKTLRWQEPWDTMTTVALDALPATRTLVHETPWPDFWQSHAIAANLRRAATAKGLAKPLRKNLFQNLLAIANVAIAKERKEDKPKIQKAAYSAIHKNMQDPSLSVFMAKRWNDVFGPPIPIRAAELDILIPKLFNMTPRMASGIFKTLIGAWTTTCRMHEQVKATCCYGCQANDEIGHYLQCPRLLVVIKNVTSQPVAKPMETHSDKWDNAWFMQIYIYFSVYHTLKTDTETFGPLRLKMNLLS